MEDSEFEVSVCWRDSEAVSWGGVGAFLSAWQPAFLLVFLSDWNKFFLHVHALVVTKICPKSGLFVLRRNWPSLLAQVIDCGNLLSLYFILPFLTPCVRVFLKPCLWSKSVCLPLFLPPNPTVRALCTTWRTVCVLVAFFYIKTLFFVYSVCLGMCVHIVCMALRGQLVGIQT